MLVRWYLAYSLSYRDIEELALERGLKVDHSSINRGSVANFFQNEKRSYFGRVYAASP